MGILNRFGKSAVDPFDTTIIANGTKVKGEIEVGGNVHVDGEFTGPIRSNRIVSIGKGGHIKGDIVSKKLVVTGHFSGTVDCDEISILAGGKVIGQITSKVMIIEKGSFFEGENRVKDAAESMADATAGDKASLRMPPDLQNVTFIKSKLN